MNLSIVKTRVYLFLCTLLVVVSSAVGISAQSGTATIRGTVTDQNGGAVPGATVRLVNPEKGFNRTTVTNDDGTFSFPTISPDTYQLEVEAQNFKKTVKSNIRAAVDTTVESNITLEPGDVSAVVNVTSNTIESVINTQDATIGNNFTPQQITQLPTELRNINNLLSLQPGVTSDGYVAGGRSDQANITLDGVDVNDQQSAGAFESVLRLTAESIEEFRITTTNANANQGRSSGAQISLVTKSGTNQFRGALFEFFRPTWGSANSFFNNLAGVERPKLDRHVFGGALGGPIVKDKFFFFYSYEGQIENNANSVTRMVPLASLGRGELRFFGAGPDDPPGTNRLVTLTTTQLNQIFPQVGMNPDAIAVFREAAARYPANVTGFGDDLNTGGFRFNAPYKDRDNTHIARFDYNINDNQSLFLRGNYQNDIFTGNQYLPDSPETELWEHPYGFVVGHNWNISSSKINNFRYGLTRQAFTQGGDANENGITFRFVFQPRAYSYSLSRVTPVHNITDDFTWIKGGHTLQFGGNIRIIRNRRTDLGPAYDFATANPSFYASSGRVLDRPITNAGYTIGAGQRSNVQNAASALIGRFSQYSANFNYDIAGNVLPNGQAIQREFATEEYDVYAQDVWRVSNNLTLTLGLRYGLSRPVYETEGYQVVPNTPLGEYFDRRVQSAASGTAYNELLNFVLAGPKNDAPGFYKLDKNNFQPRIAAAWAPNFKGKFWRALFGEAGQSVIRGGFSITNDYFGQQLAVTFDQLSTLGFTTSDNIAANTFNVTNNPAPRFTGFGQNIRNLPLMSAPNRFQTPADEDQRIESSLDSTLVSPINYTWNVSFGRQLPKGMYIEASYIGRKARNLLATRDIMALNNLVDRQSGMDWYTAAGLLHDLRANNTPISAVPNIPYFQNLFPGLGGAYTGDPTLSATQEVYALVAREGVGGFNILDWTFIQLLIDDDPNGTGLWSNYFFHPQYAAFSAFSTVAKSDYHGGALTFRQRLGNSVSFDFNYTLAKSMDNASGLQTSGTYGSAFILNPLRPDDNYSASDFDIRHIINANFLVQLPFGKGRKLFNDMHPVAEALLGGWQLGGIVRWNTGRPILTPFDAAQWATNWNVQSNGVRTRPVSSTVIRSTQNAFPDPLLAYASFRNARPGETGDRNVLRGPAYSTLDMNLGKTFTMPWGENHKLQLRWEVFNVTNVQYFQADNFTRSTFGLGQDPDLNPAPSNFGNIYTDIQGTPRRMQIGLRYSF